MRRARTAAVGVTGVVLLLAGCSSSTSKPAAAPSTTGVASTATPPAAPRSSKPATTAAAPPTTTRTAPSTSSTSAAAPSTSSTCNLPDKGDIIEWQKVPGMPDTAIELGGTDPEHCTWTFETLKVSSPNGAGYCTEAAWASDNPGYNADATPAPPLKKVQVVVGDCG